MSGYVFRAVVGNPAHPEYGVVSLPFPIPNEQYDHVIEALLPPMQIGDPIKQDCVVKEVDAGCWPALKALEGQTVNVDELDYLAKRLDSFFEGEDAQYQGMAHKLGLSAIKDLINLTFCCQEATVIDNFRELEKAGKAHLMNLNGGSMPVDEYEKSDGRAVAEKLIRSGGGQLTPYGVVYDNGMELEQIYDGRHFPCYHYAPSPIVAGIVSCCAAEVEAPKDWLYLPASQRQIDRALARAGIQSTDEAILREFENALPEAVENALFLNSECIEALNDMCAAIMPLDGKERAKLEAVVNVVAPNSASQITQLAENLDKPKLQQR